MKADRYTRVVLTVIALALVYLCAVLTPLPTVYAQRGLRPGDDTGPAHVVVVGWRTTDAPAMHIAGSVPLRVSGDVAINGPVETRPTFNSAVRVVLAGWEQRASDRNPGTFQRFDMSPSPRGLPVLSYPPQ